MKTKQISLSDYVYSGEGANGASYFHKSDPTIMLKMFKENFPIDLAEDELNQSHLVYEAGIPSPKPGEMVVDENGCYGIIFHRIPNKVSFSRAIGNEPERVEEYARRFARMCLGLHSTELDTTKFRSARQIDLDRLEKSRYFEPEEKEKFRNFLLSVPEATTAVHGDLQYSNAVMSDEGDMFIDLGGFSYGHPYFDIGQVLLCSVYTSPEFITDVYHMSVETAGEFWKYFVKEYFGEDADVAEVTEMIRPYSALMAILIDDCCGMRIEIFHKLMY